jgi:RNA polymerase sigma factor (sigma-70 family)
MHGSPDTRNADRYIVGKVLKGDKNAFAEIIDLSSRIVAQITFKMVAGPEDRKDLVQEIYLKTWKNLEGFRFQSRLTTWIARIAYHTCINYLESKQIKITIDITDITEDVVREQQPVYRKDLKVILEKEIAALPIMDKTLITLYHQEELSYEEMAQVTGMPVGTVKSYLFRARKALKERLLVKYKKEELWK